MSIRDSILAANDRAREPISVPEWQTPDGPATFYLAQMSGVARDEYEAFLTGGGDGEREPVEIMVALIIATAEDEGGTRLFTPADAPALAARNAEVLYRVYKVASRMNGIGKTAQESEEGKSAGVPGSSSPSASPSISA